jgi:hypothetical protein
MFKSVLFDELRNYIDDEMHIIMVERFMPHTCSYFILFKKS